MTHISKHQQRQSKQAHQQWRNGVALSKQGKWHDAIAAFESALKSAPDDDVYLLNAAKACQQLKRYDEALVYASRAVMHRPDEELPILMKARALHRLQREQEACACLLSLPEPLRTTVDFWVIMGMAQQNLAEHREAIGSFMNALAIKIDDAMSHYRMGISFYELQLKEEASECFRTGLQLGLGPNDLHVHGMLAYAERESCRWPQAEEEMAHLRRIVSSLPEGAAVMSAPFAHVTLMDDPMHQKKAAALMSRIVSDVKPVTRVACPAGSRMRIGYLSSDFYQHATCVLMAELFEHHDRSRFEVFVYSHGKDDQSAMRRRVQNASEHFIDLRGQTDLQMAERIAADGLDLLIDLKGYTSLNRLGVFARRPAPVQASFLGFPGTLGGDFIDYIIGDPTVTPVAHAAHFSEQIAQMPICYQPNDRQRPRPARLTRSQVGLPEDAFVLCGFNQAYKISPEVLDVWCGFLHDIPNSVLWLLDWHDQARPHLEHELVMRGIDLSRICWAPRWSLEHHISRIRLADIFIDTWPCNGHTTASDALWSGLPVVTYQGQTFASRVASSLVKACGMPELVCTSLQAYRDTVMSLAADPMRVAALKDRLEEARETSPLFDSTRFTRDFESLLSRMIERHRAGGSPAHLLAQSYAH